MAFTNKSVAILLAIVFIAGIGLGAWGMHTWQVAELKTQLAVEKAKAPQVKETVRTETETKFAYLPGQTVYLPSAASTSALADTVNNTPGAVATKLDGNFTIGKPNFTYMINGKVGKFEKTDDENYIFDKGMLDLKQSSTINIKADIPTIDLTRHNVITTGVFYADSKANIGVGYTGSVGKVGAYQLVGSQNGGYAGIGIKF